MSNQYIEIDASDVSFQVVDVLGEPASANVVVDATTNQFSVSVGATTQQVNVFTESGGSGDYFGVSRSGCVINRDGNGVVTSIDYANGITLTINRNGQGEVTSITSSSGKTKTIVRNGNGVITEIVHS